MTGPLVSVIVGVYNKERFVGECLRSVLAQTYPHWELIVVDDASTDRSLEEVERAVGHDSRVRIVRRRENSGHPGVTRNQALREAKGKYIAFLDADDRWNPQKLEIQVAYMEENPEYPLSHTVCEEIDMSGRILHVRHGGKLPPPGDCLEALFGHCFICTSTVMVRRDFGESIGWFSEDAEYRSGQDYEFFIRVAQLTPIGIPEGVLGEYRYVENSISREDKNWKSRPLDYMRTLSFLKRRDLWKNRIPYHRLRHLIWQMAVDNCTHWRARERWSRAGWFAMQGVRWRPLALESWRQVGGVLLKRR